ncbi:NAD-glutamate dehydrogenase [Gilvimarinus polysaccharolyticus]|uniref:NAD-glutamate dehydrogenase n=1 Tax=Gilvimarinus polysaccharolyticus TaxID=863921 RepID=UPI0006736447|nr:NAD-glutamate dehydrogenase [Gilvimarinus polysaccharolyticus]
MRNTDVFSSVKDQVVQEVIDAVVSQLDAKEQNPCQRWCSLFFNHFPLEGFDARPLTDVTALLVWLWRQLTYIDHYPSVKAFNPQHQTHGFNGTHTILVIHQRDMPFLVDSVRLELGARNIPIFSIKSTPFGAERRDGLLQDITPLSDREAPAEALLYFELGTITDAKLLQELEDSLKEVLGQIVQVVDDFQSLKASAQQVADSLTGVLSDKQLHGVDGAQEFLRWLIADHFTFLGYAEFDRVERDGVTVLQENSARRLGLFNNAQPRKVKTFDGSNPGVERFYLSPSVMAFSKSPKLSRVHRHVYPDYVVVKRFDSNGVVCGEARFLGLYTSSVYYDSPEKIPLVRDKISELSERMGINPWTHEGKALSQVIATYPRDELFQASTAELYESISGILAIGERYQVRMFARADRFGKFLTCLVYIPRELFSSSVRERIQAFIGNKIGACDQQFNTYFSESVLARVHLVFRLPKGSATEFDLAAIELGVAAEVRTWADDLYYALKTVHGEEKAWQLHQKYRGSFGESYQEYYRGEQAVADITVLERLVACGDELALELFVGQDANTLRFKLLHQGGAVALSDIIPLIENMGLRVIAEHPFKIKHASGKSIWLHDFTLQPDNNAVVYSDSLAQRFCLTLQALWYGRIDNDSFNRLVTEVGVDWRRADMLRAYAAYLRQTLVGYSADYMVDALINHTAITTLLCDYFSIKFDPSWCANNNAAAGAHANDQSSRDTALESVENSILKALDNVANLNEDRIIRHYLQLLKASLRCNFYQDKNRDCFAVKLASRRLPDIPEPKPLYEIFVYSKRFEGVHLRGSKISRGGLRWSDRLQDYRTEVLGLVKAQQVKNAVIVPSGAKGGFVCKQAAHLSRDEFMAEGIACYKQFINALLDLTDNLIDDKIVPPEQLLRYDEDDPYLVVAADKGTASFSDSANSIALEHDFWLGDAFASGGSQGYDHKAMGITARGAWVSVQRHFKEHGINVQTTPFSVIGIGDMAGDVFGNGMLCSNQTQLLAAFNHLHIFIDPSPDPTTSYAERERLFKLPRSSWADYNRDLISAGGGVFERSAKSITISAEMKTCFALSADKLTPDELIQQLLQAPVDLIWNGGIGTYVKSGQESHAAVGDKASDGLRVNGEQLRCKVFAEGGNLGMTQRGRIEFCRNGGACNTDFIDNSAGVDCSDHEVNIKILLADLLKRGELEPARRGDLLVAMTDEVAASVLTHNYHQTQAISLAQVDVLQRSAEYRRFINHLESEGKLDRALEFLPTDDELIERQGKAQGLTRPELAVLISYAKADLKEQLASSIIVDEPSVKTLCAEAFSSPLQQSYSAAIERHRLRREIIATQLANELVNRQGFTFVQRLCDATGADAAKVASAYRIARDIEQAQLAWTALESLDYRVSADGQMALMQELMRRVRRTTRWFLRNRQGLIAIDAELTKFVQAVQEVKPLLAQGMAEATQAALRERVEFFTATGVDEPLVRSVVSAGYLYSGLAVVEVAHQTERPQALVARVYTGLINALELDGFARQLISVRVDSYWQALAREAYMDDLEFELRRMTASLVNVCEPTANIDAAERAVKQWCDEHSLAIDRWALMAGHVRASQTADYAMFAVALRELTSLVRSAEPRLD